MTDHENYAELVKKAQLGDRECLDRLAEKGRVRLYEYVFRLTLQEDLTQDIIQETILEMYKVFNKLKQAERFWDWLEGIAFNKVRSHYGRLWRHKTVSLSEMGHDIAGEDSQDGLADMVNQELKQIVFRSMQELAPRHRSVLALRCYKQMPYAQIAQLLGCTEFAAQSLFYRAKKALAKKLSRHGLGKGYLLAALVLFGKMTASTEAAAAQVSVTAATLKVGVGASLAALATSKIAVVSVATVGVIGAGMGAVELGANRNGNGSQESPIQTSPYVSQQNAASQGTDQCWYFFPEGRDRPVMLRLLKSDTSQEQPFCRYLQNQYANYRYDQGTVYTINARAYNPDLSVRLLPTDNQDLHAFIARVQGRPAHMESITGRGKGLLVISRRQAGQDYTTWKIDRHFNTLEEEYFQSDWPARAQRIDRRDAMHQRGWTYFRITGRIGAQGVSGTGRMPFVYSTSKRFGPWLKLKMADGSKIVDSGTGACVYDPSGKTVARYRGGSFFKGLARPWMGLHTIDVVRRDAAEQEVWFETEALADSEQVEVVLDCKQVKLVYTIDMEADVVEKISFAGANGSTGELSFSYLEMIAGMDSDFTPPRATGHRAQQREGQGMLWLVKLLDGKWKEK